MESTPPRPTAAEAAAALADAESSRRTLAGRIVAPSWFFTSMGAAIAVQIATTAAGLGDGKLWALAAGLAVFAAVAGVQLARFRALNGVWLGGFASRVVLGTATGASASYALALAAAIWAAYAGHGWLVALWAAIGGAAYALSGRRWLYRYRADPAAHARGESLAWLAMLSVAALAGLAMLALNA
jgi:hypothetical protein